MDAESTTREAESTRGSPWPPGAFSQTASLPQSEPDLSDELSYPVDNDELPQSSAGLDSFARNLLRRCRQPLLQFSIDVLALAGAWGAAFEARLALNPLMPRELSREALLELAPPLTTILLLWVLVSAYRGAYGAAHRPSPAQSLKQAAELALLAGVLTVVVTFFSRQVGASVSRSFVLLFAPLSFGFLIAGRYAALLAATAWERLWPLPERLAIVGYGAGVEEVADRLRIAGADAVEVAGVVLPSAASDLANPPPLAVLGHTEELGSLVNRHGLERILIVDGHLSADELENCARISRRMGVVASRAVRPLEIDSRIEVAQRYGLHLLELRSPSFSRAEEVVKRALDIALSAALLVVLSPLIGLIALLVKLTSEGPVLYKAPRVGKGGRYFTFLKFRSMAAGAESRQELGGNNEHQGHVFKIREDPRITPFGRFLRRSSLDELPQLVNVLLGQMSLVGPRPLPAEDLDPDGHSKQFAAWTEQRSRVLPGISGLWQVNGRSELPFEKMVELDLCYVRNRSLWLDLRILLETPLAVLTRRGAF